MEGRSQAQVFTCNSSHLWQVWFEFADFKSFYEQWAGPPRRVPRHPTRLFQVWLGQIQ